MAAQGDNPLAALLARFQQAGLGDVAQSWVGTDENASVEPEALEGVFGAETVSAWSQQTGLDQGSLLGGVAQLLPQVIDKMTPQGQIPEGDAMQQLLAGFFGREG
ncbi:MAG: YidB family protein [Elioraea sp.]|nr:YidB family protein [Elioraea sp.]